MPDGQVSYSGYCMHHIAWCHHYSFAGGVLQRCFLFGRNPPFYISYVVRLRTVLLSRRGLMTFEKGKIYKHRFMRDVAFRVIDISVNPEHNDFILMIMWYSTLSKLPMGLVDFITVNKIQQPSYKEITLGQS